MEKEKHGEKALCKSLESQHLFRALFDNTLDAILLADDEARYIMANPAACALTGYEHQELLRLSVWDLTPEQDVDASRQSWQAFLNSSSLSGEYGLRLKDGSLIEVEFRATANVLPGVHMSAIRDISERKQAKEELERAHSQLEQEVEQRTAELSQAVSMLKSEIAERKQAEKALSWSQKRLRELNRRIVLAQEEERRRLSRELHDSAGQVLTALQLNLSLLRQSLAADDGEVGQGLDQALQMAGTAYDEIRAVSHALRPPALDIAGFNQTLAGLCQDFARHTGLDLDYQGVEVSPLPETVAIGYYRFLQEGLTNVAKHAQAEKVQVNLNYEDDTLYLSIEDDGLGFTLAAELERPEGIGLLGLQERLELLGGQLEIESQPGRGTRLIARYRLE